MKPKKVAILTAGGLAPCLSSAVGALIEGYSRRSPDIDILCYQSGYRGLLLGESIAVTPQMREDAHLLHLYGGSPIGSSRVKLTNRGDCERRGLVKKGADPLQVAAEQLRRDQIDVLHTVGGDDTSTTAAELASFLHNNGYALTVVGLPKTIDNDIYPIKQSLGAWTAAENGAHFFANIVAEHSANPRMLIVHEVMGRHSGYLTAETARVYRQLIQGYRYPCGLLVSAERRDIHGIFVPEMKIDMELEVQRLQKVMDRWGCVNIFISEGAGVDSIVTQRERDGEEVPRDAFGHVKLDAINSGKWFAEQFAAKLKAEKVMVQKSGYFARAAPAGEKDVTLIKRCVEQAIECAMRREEGVVGQDEECGDALEAIVFDRIKGGKPFDIQIDWFVKELKEIGQYANSS